MRLIASSLVTLALLSTPALADPYHPAPPAVVATGGNDGQSVLSLGANAGNYCLLGQVTSSNVSANNATVSTPTGYNSDVTLGINLQDVNDNVAGWSANISIPNSVCNHAYSVSVTSANGGLKYTGGEQGGSNFSTNVPYNIAATFGSNVTVNQPSTVLQGRGFSASSSFAYAGSATIVMTGSSDTSKYLLQGTYTDIANVTVGPRVS